MYVALPGTTISYIDSKRRGRPRRHIFGPSVPSVLDTATTASSGNENLKIYQIQESGTCTGVPYGGGDRLQSYKRELLNKQTGRVSDDAVSPPVHAVISLVAHVTKRKREKTMNIENFPVMTPSARPFSASHEFILLKLAKHSSSRHEADATYTPCTAGSDVCPTHCSCQPARFVLDRAYDRHWSGSCTLPKPIQSLFQVFVKSIAPPWTPHL